ncbi:MAG: hypothetical protein AB7V48_02410 [Sedimentibacter sp.]
MTINDIEQIVLKMSGLSKLTNDSIIVCKDKSLKVDKILAGIDMGIPEVIVANSIYANCIIGHHPTIDSTVINMHKDLILQLDKMISNGIPKSVAEQIILNKITSLENEYVDYNYDRVSSISRLFNIPYVNIHTPIDIITEGYIKCYLNNYFNDLEKTSIYEVVSLLNGINEIKNSLLPAKIVIGDKDDRVGKLAILMTCSPDEEIFNTYFDYDIKTIICMYAPTNLINRCRSKEHVNIISMGHMGCDSIGMNIFLKDLENRGVEVIRVSGLIN